jgi:dipeptidyl aminopeptidase/acylaminoacyl peptidase
MRAFRFGCCLIGLGVFVTGRAERPQLAPLPVEEALGTYAFGQFGALQFSPDGKWLVYALQDNRKLITASPEHGARTGVPIVALGVDLGLVDTATGEMRNLTAGKGSNWGAVWSPDGRYLAFLSDRDGSELAKLWVWEAASGKLRKVSDLNVRSSESPQWLRNSREVLVGALPENMTPTQYSARVLSVSGSQLGSQPRSQQTQNLRVFGSTAVIYRSAAASKDKPAQTQSDPWSLEGSLRDLACVDIASGKARRVDRGHRIIHYALSPDGSQVAYSSPQRFEKPGSQQTLFEVTAITLATGRSKVLASELRLRLDGGFSWSPDSAHLAYLASGMEANGDVFVLDLNGGSPRKISDFPEKKGVGGAPPLWDAQGRQLYFVHEGALWKGAPKPGKAKELAKIPDREFRRLITLNDNQFWSPDGGRSLLFMTYAKKSKQFGFYRVDLENGQATKLLEKDQCYRCVNTQQVTAIAPDGKQLAYFSADAEHDTDLWLTDTQFRTQRRLTYLNPQFDRYRMGTARLIEWRSLDGEKLQGALLLPAGYEEGNQYPLIVYVYGGSTLSDDINHFGLGAGGPFNMQLFATRGYAVLLPDAPLKLATPMADLAKTVLPGVDKVIELGIADPDRLGVLGHSYGGYSTLALIVQTKRFKAAMAADGYADQVGAYGQMDTDGSAFGTSVAEQGQGLMGGTPWEFPSRYIENSPISYLDRVETPLLIMHGAQDTAVHPFLSDEVFVGLRRMGKEAVYVKYEGEGHSPLYWSYPNQLDYTKRMIDWFDQHLGAEKVAKGASADVGAGQIHRPPIDTASGLNIDHTVGEEEGTMQESGDSGLWGLTWTDPR